jgi:hypothetical protein
VTNNGIFNQFLHQTVEKQPKIVGGPSQKIKSKPKNPPKRVILVEKFIENAVQHLN